MEIRPVEPEDYEAVRAFLAAEGWQQRVADPVKFRGMMRATARAVAAWEGGRVVGFARALCDEASNGYISMVAVARGWRGRGIGRGLVGRLTGDDPGITWVLRAGRGSRGFWEKLGFKASEVAMERTRK
jgi:GNAT superfamily N-acetyltransferase